MRVCEVASELATVAKYLHSLAAVRRLLGIWLLTAACVADVNGVHQESNDTDNGGNGSASEDTNISPAGYLERIATIHCDEAFMCREAFPPDRGYTFEDQWGSEQAACQQRLLDQWNPRLIETEIAKGRVKYDGTAARACLDGVTFAACPDYWNRGIEWAEACYQVLVGQVPAGGQCDIDYSCSSFNCDEPNHVCL